jgi:uncharacterized Zn finger protein (UPF0148 family)
MGLKTTCPECGFESDGDFCPTCGTPIKQTKTKKYSPLKSSNENKSAPFNETEHLIPPEKIVDDTDKKK